MPDSDRHKPRVDPPQSSGVEAAHIINEAKSRLMRHAHFARHAHAVEIEFADGTMRLAGAVPSYYLKQVLQAAVAGVPGVRAVENCVAVTSGGGLDNPARP